MAKISKAELKRALIAAEAQRAKYPTDLELNAARHPKLFSSQAAAEKLLLESLRDAGFDARKFSTLQKQHGAELERAHEREKAEAIERASRSMDTVHSSILSQARALQQFRANQFFPHHVFFTLDKPFLVWAAPKSNIISDSNIESFNSWAKIKVDSTKSGRDKLSFYFVWDNPSEFFAVINASTLISASGYCKVTAHGGFSGIDPTARFSYLWVTGQFALWEWWNQPPTSTPYASQPFGGLEETASFWDKSEAKVISNAANLDYTQLVIPPHGVVVFEVALEIGYSNGHGHIVADFESGDFKVACPVVVVSLLTPPNASATGDPNA